MSVVGESPRLQPYRACTRKCNSQFTADNDYFRDVLVLDAGAARHPEVIKMQGEQIKRKMKTRPKEMKGTLKDLRLQEMVSRGGVYLGHAPAFTVDWPRMQKVLNNVMKGIVYSVRQHTIPVDFTFVTLDVTEVCPPPIREVVGILSPEWFSFGDDVFVCRYRFSDDYPGLMACLMRFYGYRTFFGMSHPANLDELDDQRTAFSLLSSTAAAHAWPTVVPEDLKQKPTFSDVN